MFTSYYTIMSHLTKGRHVVGGAGRSISTARHADESSSSARATSAAAHELDACALAIGQSHSAWMPRPPAASLIALAASVDEIRGSAARRERVGAGPTQRLDRGQHVPRQLRARRRRTNPWRESRCRGFRCQLRGPGLARRPRSLPWEPKGRCSASTPSPRSASRGTHFATLGRRRRNLQTWQTASGRRRRVEGVAVISLIGRHRDQGSSALPLRSVGGDRWL